MEAHLYRCFQGFYLPRHPDRPGRQPSDATATSTLSTLLESHLIFNRCCHCPYPCTDTLSWHLNWIIVGSKRKKNVPNICRDADNGTIGIPRDVDSECTLYSAVAGTQKALLRTSSACVTCTGHRCHCSCVGETPTFRPGLQTARALLRTLRQVTPMFCR